MFFNKPQAINTTNLRIKFHEVWAINVTSRVLTSKAALPPGGHIFQQTETIFKRSLAIIKTNVQTKFLSDKNWAINVTPRVLTRKTAPPPGGHVFLPIQTIFKLNRRIHETNVLTKFHEDWTTNRHIEKTAPAPGSHFHDDWAKIVTFIVFTRNTAPPPGGHVFQWTETIFEINQHIIKTNIVTNLELYWTINGASRVFTRQMLTTDAQLTKGDHNSSP
ncbi:hypothetical protein DPMN_088782 [Dreissena polymorpha]|uniref:Uncharacterized protein n=1 Tax=Dreissena polymorpha TaxID=45954 RepID=A0A9D4QWQ3_DREPO|nr:hypothetical protein DPMN_088782 [Dreissena polymorpha]